MVNLIWGLFIMIGITYSILTGHVNELNNEILLSGSKAIELILNIMPLLIIWMGLMKIAEKSGLINKIAHLMTPILSKLFPSIPKDHESLGYIASNIAINMAGLGSAATPFGLKAMEKLQEINPEKDKASSSMITFLVLNTSGVTIIPTTIISLRLAAGSLNPSIIIPTCILATLCSTLGGLLLDHYIRRRNGNH